MRWACHAGPSVAARRPKDAKTRGAAVPFRTRTLRPVDFEFFAQQMPPKADEEPHDNRGAAGADGRGARGAQNAEANVNRGHEGSSNPQRTPRPPVLGAPVEQERKDTEDLLAGFDRPGRGPKKPAAERDFVDYYARKKDGSPASDRSAGAARPNTSPLPPGVRGAAGAAAAGGAVAGAGAAGRAGAAAAPTKPKQANISTVVVPRDKPLAPWVTWGVVVLLMLLVGGAVAFLASRDDAATAAKNGSSSTSTSNITSAPPSVISSRDDIPPPPPPSEVDTADPIASASPPSGAHPVATTSSRTTKRDPKNAGTSAGAAGSAATSALPNAPTQAAPLGASGASGASGAPNGKAPPRDDFIRDMGAPPASPPK